MGNRNYIVNDYHGHRLLQELTPSGWSINILEPIEGTENEFRHVAGPMDSFAEALQIAKSRNEEKGVVLPLEPAEAATGEAGGTDEDEVSISVVAVPEIPSVK